MIKNYARFFLSWVVVISFIYDLKLSNFIIYLKYFVACRILQRQQVSVPNIFRVNLKSLMLICWFEIGVCILFTYLA